MPENTIQIPDHFRVYGEITLQAKGVGEGPRRASIEAYSGGFMRFADIPVPVVLNVSGGKLATERVPILTDHQGTLQASIGHTESVSIDGAIRAEVLFSGSNAATTEVIEKLEGGMPLQASVGIRYSQSAVQPVSEGEVVTVNGRNFEGPLLVINDFILDEISVVPLGADRHTSVALAASAFTQGDPAVAEVTTPVEKSENVEKTLNAAAETAAHLADIRQKRAAEAERCDAIESLCASYSNPKIKVGDAEVSLKAHAIAEGWSADTTELQAHRIAAPKAPAVNVQKSDVNDKVLECALLVSRGNLPSSAIEKRYDEKTLELAHSPRFRRIGVQQAMLETMQCNGYTGPMLRGDALLEAFRSHELKAAGFSTVSLPFVLGNIANAELVAAFENTPSVYAMLSRRETRNDFHERTAIQMTSNLKFTKIGKDGEIKTGKLKERKYTSTLYTAAMMATLTRQDVLNDTLGAFDTLPSQMGRQGAIAKDIEFHTALESTSTSFYHASLNSLKASNAFSLAGLEAAILMWRNKVDQAGDKISVRAKYLVVPPALEFEALKLLTSGTFNETTTANTPQGTNNPYANRFQVVVDDRAASDTTWYLLADPADVAAFKNLVGPSGDTPVVEQVPVPSDVLGYSWRAYMDYGAALFMHEGVLKCTA